MALSFAENEASKYPDLSERYGKLAELFRARLWHQLTEELLSFLDDEGTDRGNNRVELFENFVKHVDHRINPLQLVRATVSISRQLYPSKSPQVADEVRGAAQWLFDRLLARRSPLPAGARVVAALEVASLRLAEFVAGGVEDGGSGVALAVDEEAEARAAARTDAGPPFPASAVYESLCDANGMRACRRTLESLRGVLAQLEGEGEEPVVTGTYHRVAAEFHREKGPAGAFYRHSLRFLSLTPLSSLPEDRRWSVASDVAQAALVAEDVHDLGTFVSHPVMTALAESPHAWLAQLVQAAHIGDVEAFATLYADNEDKIRSEHPALVDSLETVKEKVALSAVVEAVAKRPAADRTVPLQDIAYAAFRETDLDKDDGAMGILTQRLLMRGMSLGLIRGRIDEVESVVHIDAVRPRVLDRRGIQALQTQMQGWRHRVHTVALQVDDGAAEILA